LKYALELENPGDAGRKEAGYDSSIENTGQYFAESIEGSWDYRTAVVDALYSIPYVRLT